MHLSSDSVDKHYDDGDKDVVLQLVEVFLVPGKLTG